MRELKCRAWDKKRNEWFRHGELHLDMNGNVYLDCMAELCNERFDIVWYTGLKDCKHTKEYPEGQEIYEGDWVVQIIDIDGGGPLGYSLKEEIKFEGVVIWEHCGFSLDTKGDGVGEISLVFEARLEVIGNIHENKDLLNAD